MMINCLYTSIVYPIYTAVGFPEIILDGDDVELLEDLINDNSKGSQYLFKSPCLRGKMKPRKFID